MAKKHLVKLNNFGDADKMIQSVKSRQGSGNTTPNKSINLSYLAKTYTVLSAVSEKKTLQACWQSEDIIGF